MTTPRLLTSLAAAALAAPIAGAQVSTITDIAPSDAAFFVSIDDFTAARAAFDRTGMRRIWDDPSVQEWFSTTSEEMAAGIDQLLEEVGFDREDLRLPTGAMGVAGWINIGEKPDEFPPPPIVIEYVMLAEYAEEGDAMHQMVEELVERGEENESFTLRENEHADTLILSMTMIEEEEPRDAPEDEWGWEEEPPDEPIDLKEAHYARWGDHLLLSSDLDALKRAIDRMEGEDNSPSLTQNATLQRVGGMTPTGHVRAGLLVEPFNNVMAHSQALAALPFDLGTFARTMGLHHIQAAAMTISFDDADAMMSQNFAILAPEKEGLVALFDNPPFQLDPPAFISDEAASYNSFSFDFSGIVPLINRIIADMPEDQAGGMAQLVQMFIPTIQPILDNIGPQVFMATTYQRPFAGDSEKALSAFTVKDSQALSNAITNLSATPTPMGQIPLEARDFMGSTIWTIPEAGDEFALGLGGGYLFLGPVPVVENALRQAGNPDTPSLARDEDFARAAGLTRRGIGFTYTNTERSMEWLDWYMDNIDEVVIAQMGDQFQQLDPEMREEIIRNIREGARPPWMKDFPDSNVITDNVGDTIGEFRSTEDGFVSRVLILRP